MPRTFDYVSDIEAANRESGGHFFDPKTLKFFGSRVYPEVYPLPEEVGGAYFITSEKRRGEPRARRSPRAFSRRDSSATWSAATFTRATWRAS